jgi:ABC-type Fe3+/spermidine/putrescine transport system ATPase subunit
MHLPVNKTCLLAIRPEAIEISKGPVTSDNQLPARVEQIEFSGATTLLTVDANGLKVEVLVLACGAMRAGGNFTLSLPADRIRLLPE